MHRSDLAAGLLVGSLALLCSACVGLPKPAEPEPSPVATTGQPFWAATHYKVGARLYPRCMTLTATGSRVNKTRYCMTDAEVASLEDRTQSIKVDLQQRAAIHLGGGGN